MRCHIANFDDMASDLWREEEGRRATYMKMVIPCLFPRYETNIEGVEFHFISYATNETKNNLVLWNFKMKSYIVEVVLFVFSKWFRWWKNKMTKLPIGIIYPI
jgi:hypothetical protein